ncbi:MAG: hypothetical protein ACK4GU_15225 [Alishewanella aestuarii]
MSDLSLAIKLSTEGGQVVVKELTQIGQAAGATNTHLNSTGAAGKTAAKGFDEARQEAQTLNNQMLSLKSTLGLLAGAIGALGFGAFFKDSIEEQEQLQRNLLRTDAVIKATGEAAGFSAKQLHDQARALALATLQSTEGVMRAQQVLLSYSSISGDVFSRAIETATDLATLIGGSLNGSLEMLAKTLDNPIEGINAMRRQGIYFTEAQQRVIASLVETNRLAEAQSMILDELAGQFGGIAKREALGLAGAQDTLGQAMQELKIQIADQLGLADELAAVYGSAAEGLFSITAALGSGDLAELTPTLQAAVKTAELFAHVLVGLGVVALSKYALAQLTVIQGKLLLNTQAVRTVSALGMVTASAGTSTIAMNALGMATRAALGPIGLMTIGLGAAAAAFLTYKSAAEDAKKETDAMIERVSRMSNQAKASEYAKTQLELIELTKTRLELEDKLRSVQQQTSNSGFGNIGSLARVAKQLAELSAQEDILNQRLKVLNDNFEQGLPGLDSYSTLTEANTETTNEFNKALLGLYNNQRLAATAVDEYGRSLTGVDFEIFKANFKELAELPADAEAAIKRYYETAQQAAKNAGADSALKSLRQETELLKIRLAQGEKEYDIQKALYQLKGGDPAILEAIEAELRLQQELNQVIANTEEVASAAWGSMLDDMTALSTATGGLGDIFVQTFGRAAQQLDAMGAAQERYATNLKKLAEEKAKIDAMPAGADRAAAEVKYQQTLARLHRENTQAQLGQFASLTGAAKNMFSEQSKGREALHRMEMVFSAAELAMSIKASGANALKAITEAFAAPFPLNFASGAAMMAIMAGLGVFSGGSSVNAPSAAERQRTQGTGTVLGDSDAKSESIVNALDRIAELSLDQYSELRAINQSIRELNQGIAQLAVNLVRSFGRFDSGSYQGALGTEKQFQLGSGLSSFVAGGVIGLGLDKLLDGMIGGIFNSVLGGISKTTRNLVDSGLSFEAAKIGEILATGLLEGSYYNVIETTKRKLWGLSKKTSTSTEYSGLDRAIEAEFGRVFGFLATSITGAVDMLGLDLNKSLNDFVINLPNISFKDLSGDEIQKELEAIFSQQADLMVQYLVPSMAEYQKMGEGLYDTLIRVAQEQAIFNAQLDALGLQLSRFGDITAETQIAVAQSIIELMGGIEQFRDLTGQYFSAFYSESEQFEFLSRSLSQAFADLGLALPDARESFRELVDGLDLSTDAGQQLFAQLMKLVPGLDEYFKALDRQRDAAEKAAEAERKLAEQRTAFAAGFERELARLDMTSLERTLDDLRTWHAEQIAIAEELGADTEFLERLYARKRKDAIEAELEKINATTTTELQRLTSEHERAVIALNNQYQQLANSIQSVAASIAGAILDIRRQSAGWDEAGYQSSVINELRDQLGAGDMASQVRTIERLQQAISARYSAEFAAVNELAQQQQSVINELKSSYGQLLSSIQSATVGISSAMLDIRRQSAGWDEAGYQAGVVSDLRAQLGVGSASEQVATITQLQQAISARYQAEVSANRQLQDAANQRYQTELQAVRAMQQAVKQLHQAADAMLLSAASPELLGTQLNEAQSQFDALLRAAQGGDADAARQLQQVGSSYLNIAKDYYAQGSDEYATIFNQIQAAYRGINAPADPDVPSAVLEYQRQDTALQQQALGELAALQQLLEALEAEAAAEQARQIAEAEAALAKYQADTLALQQATIEELTSLQLLLDILHAQAEEDLAQQTALLTDVLASQTDALLAAQQSQIEAITAAGDKVAAAVANQPMYNILPVIPIDAITPVVPAPQSPSVSAQHDSQATEALIAELRNQREDARNQSQTLVKEVSRLRAELSRTQDMVYEVRRQA